MMHSVHDLRAKGFILVVASWYTVAKATKHFIEDKVVIYPQNSAPI